MITQELIDRAEAVWQSTDGKYFAALVLRTEGDWVCHYNDGIAYLGNMSRAEAMDEMDISISKNYFLPPKYKTPMKRVK